jgi:hypothetical protein
MRRTLSQTAIKARLGAPLPGEFIFLKTAASDFKIRAFQDKVLKASQQGGAKRKASNMKSA